MRGQGIFFLSIHLSLLVISTPSNDYELVGGADKQIDILHIGAEKTSERCLFIRCVFIKEA